MKQHPPVADWATDFDHTDPRWIEDPFPIMTELRDRCASAGGQRVVRLGSARAHLLGNPHDAMYPLQRFVHWMSDEAI